MTHVDDPNELVKILAAEAGLNPEANTFTLQETARMLRCHRATVSVLSISGKIDTVATTPRVRLITRDALVAYLDRLNANPHRAA